LGIISLQNDEVENLYGGDDIAVLQTLAGQVAVALENARLYADLADSNKQLAALQDIGVKLASQLDQREVLEAIVQHAAQITGADFFTLFPYDPDKSVFENGIRRGKIEEEPAIPSSNGFAAEIAKRQQGIFVQDVEQRPEFKRQSAQGQITRAFAGIPLISRGKSVGVLYVNYVETHLFSQKEQEIIQLLANQAAVAIENARLYSKLLTAQTRIAETEAVFVRANLAADLVHRMNNVAGTIPIWVELIRRELPESNQEILDYLTNIEGDIYGILGAAEQIKEQPEKQRVDLRETVKSVVNSAGLQYPEMDIKLDCKEELLPVLVIPSELQHALWSIVQNGIEAMSGKGSLEVRIARKREGGKNNVHINVKDEGTGISVEIAQRLFSPFFTTKVGHTGYGLWRSKQTIEGIGGRIEFINNPDQGTTFTVVIPIIGKE